MKALKQFWLELWQPTFLECGFRSAPEKDLFDKRIDDLLRWVHNPNNTWQNLQDIKDYFQKTIVDPYYNTEAAYIITKRSSILAAIGTKERDLRLRKQNAFTKHPDYGNCLCRPDVGV